jgi:hypothetical protein
MNDTEKWTDAVRNFYGPTVTDEAFNSIREEVMGMIENDYSLVEIVNFVASQLRNPKQPN